MPLASALVPLWNRDAEWQRRIAMLDALEAALERRFELIRNSGGAVQFYTPRRLMKAVLRTGVAIFENRHGEHSKLLLIDDTLAVFGSYNFEDAAHDRVSEAMMASTDARFKWWM